MKCSIVLAYLEFVSVLVEGLDVFYLYRDFAEDIIGKDYYRFPQAEAAFLLADNRCDVCKEVLPVVAGCAFYLAQHISILFVSDPVTEFGFLCGVPTFGRSYEIARNTL